MSVAPFGFPVSLDADDPRCVTCLGTLPRKDANASSARPWVVTEAPLIVIGDYLRIAREKKSLE